jgi:hypothetical protein
MEICRRLRSSDVIGKVEEIWKEEVVLCSRYCLGIYLEGAEEKQGKSVHSRRSGRDSNQASPEFMLRALLPSQADVLGGEGGGRGGTICLISFRRATDGIIQLS